MITSPLTIILSDREHAMLTTMAGSGRTEQRMVRRARIVLAAARGASNATIAIQTGLHVDTPSASGDTGSVDNASTG